MQVYVKTKKEELYNDIAFFINNGMNKEEAIKKVRNSTILGKKHWEEVIEQIDKDTITIIDKEKL